MSIKGIKKLAQLTYSGTQINERVLRRITSKLTRSDLKLYIRVLKSIDRKRTVKVYVPNKRIITQEIKTGLAKFFENKDLEFIEEPGLIAGLRIVDNDTIYELNLKDSLENMVDYIKKSYD